VSWLSLALTLVKLGVAIFNKLQDQAKEKVGEDREKLRQLTAMQAVSITLKEVDARFERMTDEEVLAELEKQGDFRE
jgi:hypothetical protein